MSEFQETHHLTIEDKKVTLIGTAHVSKASAEIVEKVIDEERPDTVCVELCQARYEALSQKKQWQETNLFKVIREKKAVLLLLNLMLAHFQKKIGASLGVKPGEEMIRAIKAGEDIGATIHLADRDIRTTLSRTWRPMSLWRKLRLLAQFLFSLGEADQIQQEDVEKLKRRDALDAVLSEMGEAYPEIRNVLIDERDQYLTKMIRTAPGTNIVAVVGAGHVPGIQKYWREPIDTKALLELPPKRRVPGILKWGLPILIIGLIVFGFASAGVSKGTHMITWWVAANAILAGLGATVAFGHPVTILSAVVASPLTSLNPMIAAGWVAGLVEAFMGKPKVKDFERLPEDITSLKGFWRNKITRILMVVVFTNLGSSIGTFVAIPLMVKALA
jgi:pheromone shutdown-related protein TraB